MVYLASVLSIKMLGRLDEISLSIDASPAPAEEVRTSGFKCAMMDARTLDIAGRALGMKLMRTGLCPELKPGNILYLAQCSAISDEVLFAKLEIRKRAGDEDPDGNNGFEQPQAEKLPPTRKEIREQKERKQAEQARAKEKREKTSGRGITRKLLDDPAPEPDTKPDMKPDAEPGFEPGL